MELEGRFAEQAAGAEPGDEQFAGRRAAAFVSKRELPSKPLPTLERLMK